MEQMYTIRETCAKLHIAESTLRGLIDHDKLRVVHIGRLVRIPESSITRLLDPCRVGADLVGTPVAHLNTKRYLSGQHRRGLGHEKEPFTWQR